MASGEVREQSRRGMIYQLIDAIGATDDGVWVDTFGLPKKHVDITGITTATVEIREDPSETRPANNTHGNLVQSVTADGGFFFESAARWVKLRILSWAAGSISSKLTATK